MTDWTYMENFMRNIESKQILRYLQSIDSGEYASKTARYPYEYK